MYTEIQIVISGSFRKHLHEIGQCHANFQKSNVKVLAPITEEAVNKNANFVYLTSDDPGKSADILEADFMAKITQANFLYLANVGGYVGQSAATEIAVALMSGIPIVATEEIKVFSGDIPSPAQKLIKKSISKFLPIKEINLEHVSRLNLSTFKPIHFSISDKNLLQSLINNLLESLKSAK